MWPTRTEFIVHLSLRSLTFITHHSSLIISPLLSFLAAAASYAAPGDGFRIGSFALHAEAGGGAGYDSRAILLAVEIPEEERAEATPEELAATTSDSDTFYESAARLLFQTLPETTITADGSLFYRQRTYQNYSEQDRNGYGQHLSLRQARASGWSWRLYERVARDTDFRTEPVIEDAEIVEGPDKVITDRERDVIDLSASLGKVLTRKTTVSAGYAFTRTDYEDIEDPTPEEGAEATAPPVVRPREDLDWTDQVALLQADLKRTEKTSLFFEGLGGAYSRADGRRLRGMVGVMHRADKLHLRAGLGYEYYGYDRALLPGPEAMPDPVTGLLPVETERETGGELTYDLRLTWRATEKTSAYLFANNQFQSIWYPALVYRTGFGGNWQPTARFRMNMSALLHIEDPLAVVEEPPVEVVEGLELEPGEAFEIPSNNRFVMMATARYTFHKKWLDLLGSLVYEDFEDQEDRLRLLVGLVLAY